MASKILITPEFRMSYPNLVTPRAFKGKSGEPVYNVEMLFPAEQLEEFKLFDEKAQEFITVDVRQVASAVAKEEWAGIDVKAEFQVGKNWPILTGDDLADKKDAAGKSGDAYRGMKVIRAKASNEYPPRLYCSEDGQRKQLVRGLETDENRAKQLFVGGHYAFAEVTCKAQETPQGKFITFYINSVRFLREGERLGSPSLMDRFDGVQGGQEDYDPTAGMDDEIPV